MAARLKKNLFRCRVVDIFVRDNGLFSFTRQKKLEQSTDIVREIAENAMALFRENYSWKAPIRSIGVRGAALVTAEFSDQLSLFSDPEYRSKQHRADESVDDIRRRCVFYSVQRGIMLTDGALSHIDAEEDHTVHPQGYFGQ